MLNAMANAIVMQDDEDEHYPRWVTLKRASGERERIIDLAKSFRGIKYDAREQRPFRVADGQGKVPVTRVTWHGAKLFCEIQGKRLPTENEWEAAARGRDDRRFPWGSELPRCGDVVIKNDGKIPKTGACKVGDAVEVQPVGTALQDVTVAGVHDLGGNVTEWTSSL